MPAVCHPDAAKPLNKVSRAAASSRCMGCGSNSAANLLMSSSVTLIVPLLNFMPSVRSSNHSIMCERSGSGGHQRWGTCPSWLLPPSLHRVLELRGRAVFRPYRLVFLALKLDQVGRRERVLPGLVEL